MPTQNVLVFCLSGLGDTIMASPALAALAAARDRFRLTLLTMLPWVAEYLRDQEFTDDVRVVDFLKAPKSIVFRQLYELRRERFDVSVVPYPHNRREYNGVSFVIGARQRIGFRYQKQSIVSLPFLNQIVLNEAPKLHCVEENLRWATLLLGTAPDSLPSELIYRTSPAGEEKAAAFLREHHLDEASPLIGIHASCNTLKNQQNRCWPTAKFGEFIQRLQQRFPTARFLLFEGPADAHVTGTLCQLAPDITVARRRPMPEVRALMTHCDLFVCNLSGVMHVAAAAKVPMVTIYGPTNPVWDYPWKCEHIIVNRHLPCSPCFYYGSRPLDCPARLDYACVCELPVDDVEKAAVQLLKRVKV